MHESDGWIRGICLRFARDWGKCCHDHKMFFVLTLKYILLMCVWNKLFAPCNYLKTTTNLTE